MRRALLAMTAVLAIGAAAGWAWVQTLGWQANSVGPSSAVTRVLVTPGSSLRAVLKQIAKQGALNQPRLFEVYLRCCNAQFRQQLPAVKAGEYLLPAGASALAIVQQLGEGRVILEQLTVVEGWTFAQMRAALDSHPRIAHVLKGRTDAEVMTALGLAGVHPEGRFLPDTLRFAAGTADQHILQLAHANLARELAAAWQQRAPDLPIKTADEALILASIIEKETGVPDERRRVAGVLSNRLRINMKLQTDPTVVYGLGARYDGDIRKRDLTTDTPYNTYTRHGLPPTPIALPGKDSIWAAVQPDKTEALYFMALGDASGRHDFTRTFEEHQAAIRRYDARRRARGL
ncbi:MAG: endolytic transglycosylase MltG [Steroidobacteraceae bacterium]